MNWLSKKEDEKKEKTKKNVLTTVLDPFNKASVTDISVSYRKSAFSEDWNAYGTVEFTNGNTTGKQRFEGKTFNEVLMQVNNFLNNEL